MKFVHYDAILTDDFFDIGGSNSLRLNDVTDDDVQKLLSITVPRNVTLVIIPMVESEE